MKRQKLKDPFAPPMECKTFDCGFATTVTWNGVDWGNSTVPMATYVDTTGSPSAYTASALIPSANGAQYGQVEGNKYWIKKIKARGVLRRGILSDQADVQGDTVCRLLLIEDCMPNGVQATGDLVLQDLGTTNSNIGSYKRLPFSDGRYNIIYDETFIMNGTVSSTDGANTTTQAFQSKKFRVDFRPFPAIPVQIKSGNATPTVAGLITKNYFFLLAGMDATGTAVAVSIVGGSRCSYYD